MPDSSLRGYLWGFNSGEPTIVGNTNTWHWRAQAGVTLPYWALWNGSNEVGIELYPIHEAQDWPNLLQLMLEGLTKE
jgi:hypothetical protein